MEDDRRQSADPSLDVGAWTNVEETGKYATWHRGNGGTVAAVLVEDTAPGQSAPFWAHAELYQRRPDGSLDLVSKADEYIAEGGRREVMEEAREWMRRNPNWQGQHGRYADAPADRGFGFGGEFW
jgi:hypothetical protein